MTEYTKEQEAAFQNAANLLVSPEGKGHQEFRDIMRAHFEGIAERKYGKIDTDKDGKISKEEIGNIENQLERLQAQLKFSSLGEEKSTVKNFGAGDVNVSLARFSPIFKALEKNDHDGDKRASNAEAVDALKMLHENGVSLKQWGIKIPEAPKVNEQAAEEAAADKGGRN